MKVVARPDSGSDTHDSASDDMIGHPRHVPLADMNAFVTLMPAVGRIVGRFLERAVTSARPISRGQ